MHQTGILAKSGIRSQNFEAAELAQKSVANPIGVEKMQQLVERSPQKKSQRAEFEHLNNQTSYPHVSPSIIPKFDLVLAPNLAAISRGRIQLVKSSESGGIEPQAKSQFKLAASSNLSHQHECRAKQGDQTFFTYGQDHANNRQQQTTTWRESEQEHQQVKQFSGDIINYTREAKGHGHRIKAFP